MGNSVENFDKNSMTTEISESQWEFSNNKGAKLKDLKHLEMAYEWLQRNGNGSQLRPPNFFMECEFFEPRESALKNWEHLEMAYTWLKNRKKFTPLILKRRIWWEPVQEASCYVVYLSQDRSIFYPGNFKWRATDGIMSKVVNKKTELILPNEWPEFPKERGTYYIGITARDDLGNESDPLILGGLFKFFSPTSPLNGGIEYL
jgi:hypothetical protein